MPADGTENPETAPINYLCDEGKVPEKKND